MNARLCRCGCGRKQEPPELYRRRAGRNRRYGYAAACWRRWDATGRPPSGPPPTASPPPPPRRPAAVCGTDSGYSRHIRRREPTDQACRDAHAAAKWARTHPATSVRGLPRTTASAAARMDDYAWLRSWGKPLREAAARVGVVNQRTISRYEAAYQANRATPQREDVAA